MLYRFASRFFREDEVLMQKHYYTFVFQIIIHCWPPLSPIFRALSSLASKNLVIIWSDPQIDPNLNFFTIIEMLVIQVMRHDSKQVTVQECHVWRIWLVVRYILFQRFQVYLDPFDGIGQHCPAVNSVNVQLLVLQPFVLLVSHFWLKSISFVW